MTTETKLEKFLGSLGACEEAVVWCKGKTLSQAWEQCERADWMLWLCGKMAGKTGWPNRKQIVLVACLCAERGLPLFESKYPKDDRPRKAIDAARSWASGEIEIVAVRKAAYAAYAAHAAAAAAAYAYADADAAHAADRAAYAYAAAAAYAAYAAAHAAHAAAAADRAAYAYAYAVAAAYAYADADAAHAADRAAAAADRAAYAYAYADADAHAYAAKKKELSVMADIIRKELSIGEEII